MQGGIILKKGHLLIILIITTLIISLLFGTYTLSIQKQQKQTANNTLMQSLSETATCFGVDYTKLDEESKIFYYMRAAANLHTAIYILPYTSFSEDKSTNQELINSLSGLYLSITVQSTPKSNNRWIAVTEKRQAIFECLHYISLNPKDKDKCKALEKIAKDIGY